MTQVKSQSNTMVIEPIKVEDNYRLYKIDNHYELWMGVYTTDKYSETGVLVGYVSNPDNFEDAIDTAKEELAYLMAEVGA